MDIFEFLAVVCVGVVPAFLASIHGLIYPGVIQTVGKVTRLLTGFIQPLGIIMLMLYIASRSPEGWKNIGLQINDVGIAETGVLMAGVLLLYLYAYLHAALIKDKKANVVSQMFSDFDTRPQRLAYWLAMLVGILAEELIFRGYLVLWLGEQTGNIAFWAIISVVLSVLAHLYQGVSRIGMHVILATTLVLVTITAGNIVLVVLFHIFWNSVQVFSLWSKVDAEKKAAAGKPIESGELS